MDRPVMNPPLFEDEPDVQPAGPSGPSALRRLTRTFWRALVRLWVVIVHLLRTRISFRRHSVPEEPARPLTRWVRWALFRLVLVPPAIAACVMVFVHSATHPAARPAPISPASLGIYCDRVMVVASDGVRSEAWLAPALEPRDVLAMRDRALRLRSPAVVLVHDQGMDGEQLLPLVRPLHEAGFVIVMLNLRGAGTATPAAQTFGLKESRDVLAAVEMVRRRPFVDPQKIAVVGIGTGASAALLAARDDKGISTLVLDGLPDGTSDTTKRLLPPQRWLTWLAPVCKWTFELTCKVDADDLDPEKLAAVLESRNVLRLPKRPGASFDARVVQEVTAFLKTHLADRRPAVAGGSQ